jgi:hypothetical protein
MPQVDIYNASSHPMDFISIFKDIENTILLADSGAGQCKSRGHAIHCAVPSHVLVSIGLLQKKHRDKVFMDALTKKLLQVMSSHVTSDVFISVNLYFLSPSYESCFGNDALKS